MWKGNKKRQNTTKDEDVVKRAIKAAGLAAAYRDAIIAAVERQGGEKIPGIEAGKRTAKNARETGVFLAQNQKRLRDLVKATGADYEAFTRVLNDAVYSALGVDKSLPLPDDFSAAALDSEMILSRIERDLILLDRLQRRGIIANPCINMPSAVPALLLLESVGAAERDAFEYLKKKQASKSVTYQIRIDGNLRIVLRKHGKTDIEKYAIKVEDVEKFKRDKSGATGKLAALMLMKAAQNLAAGIPLEEWILLQPDELVNFGMYQDRRDAINALNTAAEGFKGLSINGAEMKNRASAWYPFFDAIEPAPGGGYIIKLNAAINWSLVCRELTVIPWFFFILSNRAAALLWHLYFVARQRGEKLKKEKSFTIKLTTVIEWLFIPLTRPDGLPLDNPKRLVKEPIYNAAAEIMQHGGGEILTFETITGEPLSPDAPLAEWAKGVLRMNIERAKSWPRLAETFRKNKKVIKAAEDAKKAAKTDKTGQLSAFDAEWQELQDAANKRAAEQKSKGETS